MAEEPNYLAHAFKSQYNVIGLLTAFGFAILSGSALPLILAAGVEMVVLPLVSGSGRYQRMIRARISDEQREEKETQKAVEVSEMLQYMPEVERRQYRELQNLAGEIRHNYKGLDASSRMLLDDLVRKLDFLLGFYVRMRYSLVRYQAYFNTTDPDRIQDRIQDLEREIASAPERLREIKARTRSVLNKRMERYKKALENKHVMEAQTETVQEVLQLLRDQSYSMRDPRTITEQLDGLVASAEETERGVKDMEDILVADDEMLLPGIDTDDIEAELDQGRTSGGQSSAPSSRTPIRPAAASPPPPPRDRKKITH